MNLLDVGAILLLIYGLFAGVRSGALPQVGGFGGAIAGGAIVLAVLPVLQPILDPLDPPIRAFGVLVGFIFALGLGETIGSTLGHAIRTRLGQGFFGALDQVAGGVVGLVQGFVIVWLVGGLLAAGPLPGLAGQAQKSAIERTVSRYLPPPTAFAGDLSRLLDASGLPEVFIGLEPVPAPPVERPANPQAEAIGRPAEASTTRVTTVACGYVVTGTGFVVRTGYVVTNAHVVAGSSRTVVTVNDEKVTASAVLFDPELDVALLYAPGLDAPPLHFASATPKAGTQGAALGHPEGRPLTIIPAAVSSTYPARGRDLYGDNQVVRNIIELRADVKQGDSGGPFVLPDGSVGGVVFAESRSDPDVGYALAPGDVSSRVAPALGRTAAVSTGECVR